MAEQTSTLGGSGNAGDAGANANGTNTGASGASNSNASNSGDGTNGTVNNTALSGGSTDQKTWRDSLPDDLKSHAALVGFKDIESLTKSYIHAQTLVGKKGVIPPGEKATPEEWNNFYSQLGVPSVDKYDVKSPDKYELPDEVKKQFIAEAHKNGLLPKQAEGILGWYAKFEADSLSKVETETKAAYEEQMKELRSDWGDSYDKNIKAAQFAVKQVGGDEFLQYLNKTGMGNDVMLIRFAAKVSELLGEDKLREGGVASGAKSPADIQNEIREIQAKGLENGFYDKAHPMHKTTMARWESLHKQATGGR